MRQQRKRKIKENDGRGEVLVAIVQRPLDMTYAREQHWYRIPVESVEKRLKHRWPPKWLAFYQTKAFGSEAFAVRYYAHVKSTSMVSRHELFPDEPRDEKSGKTYYKLSLGSIEQLLRPIHSRRWRRIVFIPTTLAKFHDASEINDLYDESPLEDKLWAAMKRIGITAERQDYVRAGDNDYALDFAIYCALGKIDVETDGDKWHIDSEKSRQDNRRDNDLETHGWRTIRFSSKQIREECEEYCVPTVRDNVNALGGVEEPGRYMPRKIHPDATRGIYQPSIFDTQMESQPSFDEDEIWRDSIGD
jgi:very-short-patch-repair endonuclease